jgi:hypothetical protein
VLGDEGTIIPRGVDEDPLGRGEGGLSAEGEPMDLSWMGVEMTGDTLSGGVTTIDVSASLDSVLLRPGGNEGTSC